MLKIGDSSEITVMVMGDIAKPPHIEKELFNILEEKASRYTKELAAEYGTGYNMAATGYPRARKGAAEQIGRAHV